jgi:predicted glycosyltransferase
MGKFDLRVLVYSQDGFGLGHLRRNLNISLQIKKRYPTASVLIIADSPVAPFFKLPSKCDFVKLPTIVKVDMGIWEPDHLPVSYRELLRIRSAIIYNVALSFRPQFFLVDHMPHGVLGELARPLEKLKRSCPNTKLILGLRDILGAPDVICKYWCQEGAYTATEQFYDRVYVYGSADLFHCAREYQFSEILTAKTSYCGYVCRDDKSQELRESVLAKFFSQEKQWFVLVTGGGGHDASYFMDKFIDAVRLFHPHIPFNAMIATGPFMHPEQIQLLRQKAKGLPIAVTSIERDGIAFLKRADLVISMAGYNTITEILRFRKNAIIVPRPGPSAEQTMRARIMSERGLFSVIHTTQLTPANLAELMMARLEEGSMMNGRMLPELNGAAIAAALLPFENQLNSTAVSTPINLNNRLSI